MGDLMHALPALTEAKEHIADISFDWVVDKNFASVPSWHPLVDKTIVTDHRNWRRQLFSKKARESLQQVLNEINGTQYDLVVDMQNNLKSALVSFLSKHRVTGMDAKSVREYPAHLAYSTKINVDKDLHAIERQKKLLAEALDYSYSMKNVDYGALLETFIEPNINLPNKYVVLVQNASWITKQWSIAKWQKLVKYFDGKNIKMILPSGNLNELERAKEIASISTNAQAIDLMPLNEIAYIIKNANFCICSDTGLAHLSALSGTPSITLYGPTETALIGTYGKNQIHIVGKNNDINNIEVSDVLDNLTKITTD
jgi:heptosyltransferase-1|tara:strand:+ start:353 stop:1291 length:939 start_codon:yes stop_codon:yes gene_type:complete